MINNEKNPKWTIKLAYYLAGKMIALLIVYLAVPLWFTVMSLDRFRAKYHSTYGNDGDNK